MHDARCDEGERCADSDQAQRYPAKRRERKMHYPIPVL
jgi:hypothetical protein